IAGNVHELEAERADDIRQILADERLAAADVEPEERSRVLRELEVGLLRKVALGGLEVDEAMLAAEVAVVGDVDDEMLQSTSEQEVAPAEGELEGAVHAYGSRLPECAALGHAFPDGASRGSPSAAASRAGSTGPRALTAAER